jgi:hypothetical protein
MMAIFAGDEAGFYLILTVFLTGLASPGEAGHGWQSTPAG